MPKNATEIGQRRHYEWRGERLPSVTTLLKTWPMEWAIAYGAKHVAERAMTPQFLSYLDDPNIEPDQVLRWLKAAPAERRDAAADAGTGVHEYLEERLNGGSPFGEDVYTPLHEAIDEFLHIYSPTPLYVESQLFSISEKYAGSADAFVDIYGKRYVLDLKTGQVDHKARLQLAAYRFADFIGEDDREVAPVPICDGALILSVPRDDPRSWQLIEVQAGYDEFRMFLHFARAWTWYDASRKEGIGEQLLMQTEGDVA